MTAALEGGEWSAARPGRTLPPGRTRYRFYRSLGGPQGQSGQAEHLVPTGIRSRTLQPVVSRYTDWATRPTLTAYRLFWKYMRFIVLMYWTAVRLLWRICYNIYYYIFFSVCNESEGWNLRTALFWTITQRAVVISYRRFGTTCRSHLQGQGRS